MPPTNLTQATAYLKQFRRTRQTEALLRTFRRSAPNCPSGTASWQRALSITLVSVGRFYPSFLFIQPGNRGFREPEPGQDMQAPPLQPPYILKTRPPPRAMEARLMAPSFSEEWKCFALPNEGTSVHATWLCAPRSSPSCVSSRWPSWPSQNPCSKQQASYIASLPPCSNIFMPATHCLPSPSVWHLFIYSANIDCVLCAKPCCTR